MRPYQQDRMLSAKMFTLKVPVCQINTSLVVQISASKAEIFKLVLVLIVTVTDFLCCSSFSVSMLCMHS